MKEIKAIISAYNSIDFSTTKAALATVARVEGSSYRRTGARMLVLDNGNYLGGISGGCLEGDALRRAQKAIAQNKPSIVTYDTTQDDGAQIGVGLGCNGIIDVLFTPLSNDENNPIKLLSTLTETREPRVVAAVTGCSERMSVLGKATLYENDEQFLRSFPVTQIASDVLRDIKRCLNNQSSSTVTYCTQKNEEVKIFIEVILPVVHLVLYGGGYDVHPPVHIARELGWNVTVVTNIHKADKALFATATQVLHNKGEQQPVIDNYSAIVLMAHDYKTDFNNLRFV